VSIQTSTETYPLIDREALDSLFEMLGDDVFDIIDKFIVHVPVQLKSLSDALQQGNFESVKRITHQLKSSSASLGVISFSMLCQTLENEAVKGKEEQVTQYLEAMRSLFVEVRGYFLDLKRI